MVDDPGEIQLKEIDMPLKWEQGKNPYVLNSFAKLQAGPVIKYKHIVDKAQQLKRKADGGHEVKVGEFSIAPSEIEEAKNILSKNGGLAEELLMVHKVPPQEDSEVKRVLTELLQRLGIPVAVDDDIPLVHPMCLGAFAPPPGKSVAPMPAPEALGLISTDGSTQPLDDVIFDY